MEQGGGGGACGVHSLTLKELCFGGENCSSDEKAVLVSLTLGPRAEGACKGGHLVRVGGRRSVAATAISKAEAS